ncbi:DUF3313 domain-containing protein [Echinimonas agarilytica]|uniref:DUF3313 domain-containing protein n=1 Tax=Echinimonas agarilytica TaxID=1215918 RepID=A0AA41W6J1_9GAMM|nr:DUF3313 domain-containing protein [Echinimonas agarilytica]MCM2679592.1 DUF3313 domain-containing protein [Echinimonas agarilytica]
MKKFNLSKGFIALFGASMIAIAGGCANSQGEIESETEFSGYLDNYENLTAVDDEHFRWVSKSYDAKKYTKLVVEPVELYIVNPEKKAEFEENPKVVAVTQKVLAELTDELKKELSKTYEIVDTAGPDTLVFASALTSSSSQPLGMTGWEVMPIGAVVGSTMALTGNRARVVQLVWEGKISDGASGELVVTGIKKGIADQEEKEEVTLDDFMIIVKEFAKETGASAANLLSK